MFPTDSGKFGNNSKLCNVVNIEHSNVDLKRLADNVINQTGGSLIESTHDLCIRIEGNAIFKVHKVYLIDLWDYRIFFSKSVRGDPYHIFLKIFFIRYYNSFNFVMKLKVFVVERCEYFRTFLNDPFNELIQEQNEDRMNQVAHIELNDISRQVLVEILHFIYSNDLASNNV